MQAPPTRLPRRDLWLLPLIACLTALTMLAAAEIAARMIWPEQPDDRCAIVDADGTRHFRPNCRSTMKIAEGPWYGNRYNDCGYRTRQSCGPVPPGTTRLALIGSSIAQGLHVPEADTIGVRLGDDLTALCRAPVEVQNLGAEGAFGAANLAQLDHALALRPSAVVLLVTAYDVQMLDSDDLVLKQRPPIDVTRGVVRRVVERLRDSRAFKAAEHVMLANRDTYLSLYLRDGDKADYLRRPLKPLWQARVRRYDRLIGLLGARAGRAGVPLVLAYVPPLAPLLLMTSAERFPGVDPEVMGERLRAIAGRHGVGFVDGAESLRRLRRPEQAYYLVDAHLAGAGQPIVAAQIARAMAAAGQGCGGRAARAAS